MNLIDYILAIGNINLVLKLNGAAASGKSQLAK
jgi:hypothetical protein